MRTPRRCCAIRREDEVGQLRRVSSDHGVAGEMKDVERRGHPLERRIGRPDPDHGPLMIVQIGDRTRLSLGRGKIGKLK